MLHILSKGLKYIARVFSFATWFAFIVIFLGTAWGYAVIGVGGLSTEDDMYREFVGQGLIVAGFVTVVLSVFAYIRGRRGGQKRVASVFWVFSPATALVGAALFFM